jgi:hypothetical protein
MSRAWPFLTTQILGQKPPTGLSAAQRRATGCRRVGSVGESTSVGKVSCGVWRHVLHMCPSALSCRLAFAQVVAAGTGTGTGTKRNFSFIPHSTMGLFSSKQRTTDSWRLAQLGDLTPYAVLGAWGISSCNCNWQLACIKPKSPNQGNNPDQPPRPAQSVYEGC